jgi:hypothetical protein
MDNNLVAVAVTTGGAIMAWMARVFIGQSKRLFALEKANALTQQSILHIGESIDATLGRMEKMESNHRQDIVRAYQKIECFQKEA